MNVLEEAATAYAAGDLNRATMMYREAAGRGLMNLGLIAADEGRFAEAERCLRDVLRLSPGSAPAAYNLGTLLLSLGHYPEGLRLYEARRNTEVGRSTYTPDTIPEWRGEPLDGKRLLVLGEQGFGDQIMFARFVRELSGDDALDVDYLCGPEVAPVISGSLAELRKRDLVRYDMWALVGSLPFRLGVTLQTIPPPNPITSGEGRGGVGVMVRGRPEYALDAHRSLDAATAAKLLVLGRDLHPEATGAKHFAETAEIIRGLDLVITVDTAVAHLAGSMGKPTWVLLPAIRTDWRWGREAATTPWYPTARLFRQPTPGDWASVLQQVREALTN